MMVQKHTSIVGWALLLALFAALEPPSGALASGFSSSEPLPAASTFPDTVGDRDAALASATASPDAAFPVSVPAYLVASEPAPSESPNAVVLPPEDAGNAVADSTGSSAWWLLLPFILLGLIFWWLRGRRSSEVEIEPDRAIDPIPPAPPSESTPESIPPTVVSTADSTASAAASLATGARIAAESARSNNSVAANPTPDPWESASEAEVDSAADAAINPALAEPLVVSPVEEVIPGTIPDATEASLTVDALPLTPDSAAPAEASPETAPDLSEVAQQPIAPPDRLTAEQLPLVAANEPIAAPEPVGEAIDLDAEEPAIVDDAASDSEIIEEVVIVAANEPAIDSAFMTPAIEEEVLLIEMTEDTTFVADVVIAGAAAGAVPLSAFSDDAQSAVEAAKFDVGQTDLTDESLAVVDEGLPDLPEGYGESRIVLMPRDPQWLYAYWDIPNTHKEDLRRQGGQRLALRFYDVTDIDLNAQSPHSLQQLDCDELARDWYIPVPVSDRDYVAEIGYLTEPGDWLMLARSAPVRVPPVYPSDWFEDHFVTLTWEEDLQGRTILELVPPSLRAAMAASLMTTGNPLYDHIFGLTQSVESLRVAGSLFGSIQMVPEQAVSSFVFPSGIGMWAGGGAIPTLPTASGIGMSGVGMMMSGIGFSASMPPIRPRQFWLVADAELIVYGATEPDATVTIAGQPIKLNPDGTFRFQMSFQDGLIDYPILAVAADGEQTRSIHMTFTRETPERNTNTKDEAIDEWPS